MEFLMNLNIANNTDSPVKKSVTAYKVASAVLIVAVLAVGSIAFATSFQEQGRYFVSSPVLFALYALLAVAIIFALSALLIFKGKTISVYNEVGSKVFSVITAVASAIPFIYYIYSDLTARAAAATAPSGSAESFYNGLDGITLVVTVTSILAVIFSLSCALNLNRTLTLISGYGQVIFCAAIITKLYLDFSVELNSPIKLLLQFSAAAVMIGTVSDLRVFVDKPHTPMLISSKLITALVCLLNFTGFIFEAAPNIEKYGYDYTAFSILFLLYGVASAFGLFTVSVKAAPVEESSKNTIAQDLTDDSAENPTAEDGETLPEADQ